MTYKISLVGCDATTTVAMDLNCAELELLVRLAKLVNKESTYVCKPCMRIVESAVQPDKEIV